jgi:hypothetical protein
MQYGQLDVAGKAGFYNDTVSSFVRNMANNFELSGYTLLGLQVLLSLITVLPLLTIFWKLYRSEFTFFKNHQWLVSTNFIFTLLILIIISHHHLRGADYPTGRFAIFLFPIFMIQLGLYIQFLISTKISQLALSTLAVLALFSAGSFIWNAKLKMYKGWEYDSNTKEMIADLRAFRNSSSSPNQKIILSTDWLFEPTLNFYRETLQLDWMKEVDRAALNFNSNYVYTFQTSVKPDNFTVLKSYPNSKTLLLQPK